MSLLGVSDQRSICSFLTRSGLQSSTEGWRVNLCQDRGVQQDDWRVSGPLGKVRPDVMSLSGSDLALLEHPKFDAQGRGTEPGPQIHVCCFHFDPELSGMPDLPPSLAVLSQNAGDGELDNEDAKDDEGDPPTKAAKKKRRE
ncbi:hypothetical protein AK812_SmicGene2608 [Symbiodinium microadriaticum]|uniref:Uncharacterized protein n=1 Tax=Symbiodinium microadriaticum TaxID=2951 RepID=A0A1Q9F0W6_SYMMI|nr:hypothetical protein AK812_SmicGene2608 [Symbiodinium microadriaticum]